MQLQALEDGVKARQEVEQALSRFSQAPMHPGVAPKGVVDLTKNLPARNLPKFTKSNKKRKFRDESQPPEQRASPKSLSPLSSADTVEILETTATPFEDDYLAAASPSNNTATGSLEAAKAFETIEGGASTLGGRDGNIITDPALEPQAVAGGTASRPVREPQGTAEDVMVRPTPNFQVSAEIVTVDPLLEPETAQEQMVVEQCPKPQIATESISSNLPPRFRLSRLVSRPTKDALPVMEPESQPTESVGATYCDKSMPPVPHIPSSDDRPSSLQNGPLPKLEEEETQMQVGDQDPFPQQPIVTRLDLADRAGRLLGLPLPPHKDAPHELHQPQPSIVLDQKAPLVASFPVPRLPEAPPYRPLKTLHAYPPIWAEVSLGMRPYQIFDH